MPTYVKNKHDIGILRTDGTTKVGLMLARERQADGTLKPIYRTTTERYLENQYYAGDPAYGALDPQKELPIIQSDYRSGFGLEVADSNDPYRYYSSIGMDLRHRGMAIAGYTPTAATTPTTLPTATDLGVEIWTDANNLTNWTKVVGAGSLTQEAVTIHGGTYSAKIAGAVGAHIYQELAGWTNDLQGAVVIVRAWVYSGAANSAKIGINDGVGTTYSSYHSGGAAWELLTVQRTLNAAATKLIIYGYNDTAGTNYYDDFEVPTIGAWGSHWADFNDYLYFSAGCALCKVDKTAGTISYVAAFPTAITDLEPFTDDKLYIAQGYSNPYYEMTTANALTKNTGTYTGVKLFALLNAASPTMYGNFSDNTIRSTVNPANGGTDFSNPATTVGSSFYAITGMFEKAGTLEIPKEDMLYYLDSSGNVQRSAKKLQALTCSTSGKNAITDGDIIMYPCGAQSLLEIDGTTLTWRNPADYCTNLSDFVGRIFAVSYDNMYWFLIVDNSTKVEVIAARDETIDGTTSFVMHPIAEITLTGCETAFVSSVYQKRLWVASDTVGESLYYIPLPIAYGDITNDTNKSFKTDTYFITPWLHGNFKGENKAWIKATAILGHSYDADIYFECHYQKKGDSTWTDAGDFKGTATNRIATLYLPDDASSNDPVSSMMRFKIVAKTDTTATTPILLNLDIRTVLRPTHRKIIECVVLASDYIKDKMGLRLVGSSASYIRTVLNEARDASWPFTFYDINGDTKYCVMLPSTPWSEVRTDEKNENIEELFYLRMQEVTLS